jgi:RHS repeat-associated protein
MKSGGQYYWYHNDHLGTPQMMTTSSGAVVWKAKYTSFGKATVDSASTIVNPLRLPGQYEDAETGLYYNWFRYYEPEIGRYLTVDPLSMAFTQILSQIELNNLVKALPNVSPSDVDQFIIANLLYAIRLANPQRNDPYSYVISNPITWIDPFGMAIPGFVKKNIVTAINTGTNHAFTQKEIDHLLNKGEKYATFGRLWAFRNICFGVDKEGNEVEVRLTKKQAQIIDELFPKLLEENKDDPLFRKAYEEYKKGLNEKRIKVYEKPCG